MIRSSRVQVIAVLAVGGLLGYVAASSRLDVFRSAKAEPVQRAAERTADLTGHSLTQMAFTVQKAATKPGVSSNTAAHSCCSSGSARSQLFAVNNVNAKLASLQAEGKKPNIVFIMGDDVGWFNIGAYHQGIMSGKTPTSIASRGRGCDSPTTTPKRAARPAARTSSRVKFRCAPA